MMLADALAAQREAQAAYTEQLAEFAREQPDLDRIAILNTTAEAALARMSTASTTLSDAERGSLLDAAAHTADLLRQTHTAALAHIAHLADDVVRGERANDALRAYLPSSGQQPPRYLDERR